MNFTGKSVIVTGATSGIGRAAAEAFGREGASVVVVGRKETMVAEVVRAIETAGGRALPCAADITAHDAPIRFVAVAVDGVGGIDVLVIAVGILEAGTLDGIFDDSRIR